MTAHQRRAALLAAIPESGIRISDLNKSPGLRMHICTIREYLTAEERAGIIATCRAKAGTKTHERWVFADIRARDAFMAKNAAEVAQRRKAANKARDSIRAVKRKEARAKLAMSEAYALARAERQRVGEAIRAAKREAARKDREEARQVAREAKEKAKAKMRAETRSAGRLVRLKGTATPQARRLSGPAHLDGALIIPEGVEIQRSAPMRDRFAPSDDFRPIFSACPVGVYTMPPTTCAAMAV